MAKLRKSTEKTDKMFSETLFVKLRYEKIIKNILKNERDGLDLTVSDIIENTTVKVPKFVLKP